MSDEEIEESNSALKEFRRTNLELFQLILLYDDKLRKTPDIIIEPRQYVELGISGFLEKVLIDLMVIRLYRLYEIHPILGKVLNERAEEIRNLLKILSDVWNQIKSYRKKIKLWRNNRVAHSNDQAKKYVPIHIIDEDYKNTIKDILLCSRLAFWYYYVIYCNAKDLFDVADSIYETRYGKSDYIYSHQMWRDIDKDEETVISEINEKLQKGGFMTVPKPKFQT
ncbi:MAG: hypothetical protein ACREBB_11245 [Nitrosotalea sp.]